MNKVYANKSLGIMLLAILSVSTLFGLPLSQCGCPVRETAGVLAEINTALEECCEATFNDLLEIQVLTTSCCQELFSDVNLTASLIFSSTLMSSCVAATNALTVCCQQIASNFQQTFTIIANVAACPVTPIFGPGVILASGSYCLAADLVGTLTIASNNVSLALNGHSINGEVVVDTSSYIKITDGILFGGTNGLSINAATNVVVDNLLINDCSTGIVIADSDTISISNCRINTAERGIAISNSNSCFFEEVDVQDVASGVQPAIGISCGGSGSVVFRNCTIQSVFGVTQDAIGILLDQAAQVVLAACTIDGINASGVGTARGISAIDTLQNYYYNTVVTNISAASDVIGMEIENPSIITLRNDHVQSLVTTSSILATLHGIDITDGSGAILVDTTVSGVAGLAIHQVAGYLISNCSSSVLARCAAINIANGPGFLVPNPAFQSSLVLHQCIAEGITGDTTLAHGFQVDVGSGLLNRCTADTIAGSGFLVGTGSGASTRWSVTRSMASNATVGFNRLVTAAPAPGSIDDVAGLCVSTYQNWPFVDVLGNTIDCGVADPGPVIGYNTAS